MVLIGLAIAARQMRGSWLSPAAFVGLIWASYVVGCLLLTDYEVYPAGLWVIVLFVFSVQFGTMMTEGVSGNSKGEPGAEDFEGNTLLIWSDRSFTFGVLFALIATAGAVYLLIFSLEKYSLGFSPLELLSLGHLWSVDRYSGEVEPWPVRLSIMWVYPAVLLGGVSFATARRRINKYMSFAPLVPAFLIGAVFAVRAVLLFSVVCWLSGFVAVRYLANRGTYALFQKRFVASMLALMVCGFAFFIAIDTLRVFEGGDDVGLRFDAPRIYKYFFGSVPAFSSWFHFARIPDPAFGAYTFSGVFDLLGIKQRQVGIYSEMQTLAGGEGTNIYTLLRELIEDFTLPGASLFGVLLGALAGNASRLRSTNSLLVLAGYYAFLIFSPITSLFTYNGLILAWVTAAFVLGYRARPKGLVTARPVAV